VADPQPMFTKVDDQVLRAQEEHFDARHFSHPGLIPDPFHIDVFDETPGGGRGIDEMPVQMEVGKDAARPVVFEAG